MVGVGFTVMVKLTGVAAQPLDEVFIVMVATAGVLVLLIAVIEAMFPVLVAANPIEVLSFVQL